MPFFKIGLIEFAVSHVVPAIINCFKSEVRLALFSGKKNNFR